MVHVSFVAEIVWHRMDEIVPAIRSSSALTGARNTFVASRPTREYDELVSLFLRLSTCSEADAVALLHKYK